MLRGLFVLFLLMLCNPFPVLALKLVPQSMMNSMGKDAFKDIKKKTPIEKDPKINEYVQCIGNAIVKHSKDDTGVKKWEIVVFASDAVNAFALPGGKIGVYTGLMKVAENQHQLATVMGHEVGHVTAEHGNQRMSSSLASQGGLLLLGGALSDNKYQSEIMGAVGLGVQYGVLLPYGRSHESEADIIGLKLMAKAGFDPRESVNLWKNMSKAGGGGGPEFLSTHPSHKTRISDLKKNMKSPLRDYQKLVDAGKATNCGPSPFHSGDGTSEPVPETVATAAAVSPSPAKAPNPAQTSSSACQPASNKDLRHCNFSNRNLDGANFSNTNVSGISFKKSSLRDANFHKANCRGTNFDHTTLEGATFTNVDCEKAKFNKANLQKVDFTKAKLKDANFRKANVKGANFKKADLQKSNIDLAKNTSKANFEKAKK